MLNSKQIRWSLAVFAVFLLLSFIFPIHSHPYRTYFHEGLGILGVLMTLGTLACLSKAVIWVPHSVIVPVSLIVIIGIQIRLGFIVYPMDTVLPVLTLICFALALICGATLAMQENGLPLLSWSLALAFIAAGVVSVLFQNVQIAKLDWAPLVYHLLYNRPYANLAQPNMLALLLCLSVASVWYGYVQHHIQPRWALVILIWLLWGLALTQSRIAWIILPMYLILCWREPENSAKVPKTALVVLLLTFLGFVYSVPNVLLLLGTATDSVLQRAGLVSIRLVFWQEALKMSLMHPWFGAGWLQFGPQQIILCRFFSPAEYSEHAHNIILNFAAEIGWPLTLLLFGGFLYWFYMCSIRRWENAQIRFISLMILAIGVHSMVEFPLWYGFLLMPFGVMMGALHTKPFGSENITLARGWIIAFTIASLVLCGGITWDYTRVVAGFVAMGREHDGIKVGIGSTEKPEFTLFPQFYDYFRIEKIDLVPGMPKENLDFLERASLRYGFSPVLSRLALAYANNQRPEEALQVLITIYCLHNDDYANDYKEWKSYAQQLPGVYGEIFRRMPQPILTPLPMTKSLPLSLGK